MRPPVEQKTEQNITPIETRVLQREIELLRETLEQKDKIITDVMNERDKWSRLASSLQEEKQKLLTDGRERATKGGVWAWLMGR